MKTASEAIPLYLGDLESAKRSPRTIDTYKRALRLFVKIVGATSPLSEETYKSFLKKTSDLDASTQVTYRAAVCGLYEYHSPGIPLKLLNRRHGQKRPKRQIKLKEDAVVRVLEYMERLPCSSLLDYRDRAFIVTLADTGLRISEICSLTRGDIDWQTRIGLVIGKGDKEEPILFSEQSLALLKSYLAARAELDGSSGKPLESLPLFARHDDGAGDQVKRVGPKGMWAAVSRRVVEAGCKPHEISPHKFRHYFVTVVYREYKDIELAKELARHENIATTDKYAHLSREEVKSQYDKLFNRTRVRQ
jgi:integrase/recombinase XerC